MVELNTVENLYGSIDDNENMESLLTNINTTLTKIDTLTTENALKDILTGKLTFDQILLNLFRDLIKYLKKYAVIIIDKVNRNKYVFKDLEEKISKYSGDHANKEIKDPAVKKAIFNLIGIHSLSDGHLTNQGGLSQFSLALKHLPEALTMVEYLVTRSTDTIEVMSEHYARKDGVGEKALNNWSKDVVKVIPRSLKKYENPLHRDNVVYNKTEPGKLNGATIGIVRTEDDTSILAPITSFNASVIVGFYSRAGYLKIGKAELNYDPDMKIEYPSKHILENGFKTVKSFDIDSYIGDLYKTIGNAEKIIGEKLKEAGTAADGHKHTSNDTRVIRFVLNKNIKNFGKVTTSLLASAALNVHAFTKFTKLVSTLDTEATKEENAKPAPKDALKIAK